MIPFYSFENIHRPVMADMITASERVIRSGNYVFGTQDFEKEFATWMSQDHCIAVNNGTSALHLALMALDIGPGDEVVTVAHTFRATASVIKYSGATPVFVDAINDTREKGILHYIGKFMHQQNKQHKNPLKISFLKFLLLSI